MSKSHHITALGLGARLLRVAALSVLGSLAALGMALSIEACGVDSATSGRRVALETRVTLADDARSFTTGAGWDVTLTKAVISTGPFYYFDGAPPLVLLQPKQPLQRQPLQRQPLQRQPLQRQPLQRQPLQRQPLQRQPLQRSLDALGLASAFAHPGHYQAGDALGQMLDSWSVDLLAGAADLPTGDGVTGLYRSASFSFTSPPVGPMASDLEPHAAVVEGVAERAGSERLRFRASADLADIERSAANGYVDGCEFTELDVEDGGRVTVSVNPKVWFDLVDFAELERSTDDSPVEFPLDSQPKIAFAQGLAQLSAYKFSFSAP